MKNWSLVLNVVLLILVGVLFYLHFSFVKEQKQIEANKGAKTTPSLRISYVNLDSLEAHYAYFQKKRAELNQKQQDIQKQLAAKANEIQQDIKNLQEKAPTLTQSQGEAAQKRIVNKRQQLQKKEQQMRENLMNQQQEFNQDLHKRLDQFLERYNADKNYDFILSFSSANSNLLYKKKAYNITRDVIKGLNANTDSLP